MASSISPKHLALAGRTILVVDDEPIILLGTCALLTSLGHIVVRANSGAAALERLAEHPEVSLILTDLQMANMTGVELGREAIRLRPELAVIIATGRSDLSEEERHGFGMIAKPFTREELARIVEDFSPALISES